MITIDKYYYNCNLIRIYLAKTIKLVKHQSTSSSVSLVGIGEIVLAAIHVTLQRADRPPFIYFQ